MSKSKEKLREIEISAGVERSKQSSNDENTSSAKGKATSMYSPTERHLSSSPQEYKKFSFSNISHKFLGFRGSMKRTRSSENLKSLPEGALDPRDDQIVQSFRKLLFVEGNLPGKHGDDHTLLRFLKMRDYDLVKAKDMFLNYLKWREEFQVDKIVKEFQFEEYKEVKKCYPHGYHGVDKYGRPLYIERIGMVDLNTFLRVTTIDRFVKHHVSEQEKTLHWRCPACSVAAGKHIASITGILDVKDVGLANFSKPARQLFMEIQKIDSNYYPETLHRLFIVNAGSGFRALWRPIKAFLDPRTSAKIQVLGSHYRSTLVEHIDPSNLPSFLGGNCTCSDYGGCLLSDKGHWNDPEITEIPGAQLDTAEDNDNGGWNGMGSKEDLVSNTENIRIKDNYDLSPAKDEYPSYREMTVAYRSASQKFRAIEAAAKDVETKAKALEYAFEDTKAALQGLILLVDEPKGRTI